MGLSTPVFDASRISVISARVFHQEKKGFNFGLGEASFAVVVITGFWESFDCSRNQFSSISDSPKFQNVGTITSISYEVRNLGV